MRWLTDQMATDEGAIAPLVALLMVPLLGFAALTVDVGALYVERRELQNGADAAALAAAQECALREMATQSQLCPEPVARQQAERYAKANAGDGAATVESVDVSVPRTVTVRTRTETRDGGGRLAYRLAQVLGRDGAEVRAEATAIYEPAQGLQVTAFPLILCAETFHPDIESLIIQPGGQGGAVEVPCPGPGRSGIQLPGGWGWLENLEDEDCEATITPPYAFSQVGITAPSRCRAMLADFQVAIDLGQYPQLVLPMYGAVEGQGADGRFILSGFARFELWGFFFQSVQHGPPVGAPTGQEPCGPGKPGTQQVDAHSCLRGRFLEFLSIDHPPDHPGTLRPGMVSVQLIH